MHDEKVRKISIDAAKKMDKLMKKYGIKIVGSWISMPEHTNITVYDAPSTEALLKLSKEPEIMAWMSYNNTELKPIMNLEDTMKLVK
jgi:hypothetical protein